MFRSHRRRWQDLQVLVVWGALASASAPAAAQSIRGLTLEWSAPASCPASDTVLGEARRLLGPDFRHAGELDVELTVEERPGGFFLRLEVEGETAAGARELELPSCEEVRDTAGLLIALLLDPQLEVPESVAETETDAESDAETGVETGADAESGAETGAESGAETDAETGVADPRDALGLLIGVPLAGVDAGLLPGASLELGGWLGLHVWRLRFELGGVYLLPRTMRGGEPAYDVPIDAVAARPRACLSLLRTEGLELGPCAAMLIGRFSAEPDVPQAPSGSGLLLAPELGANGLVNLTSLISLNISLSARLPLRAPRFVGVTGGERVDVHEPAAVSAQAEISLVFRP